MVQIQELHGMEFKCHGESRETSSNGGPILLHTLSETILLEAVVVYIALFVDPG